MLMLWYPKCSTCQKAKKWLDEKGFACEVRDIKLENPTAVELRGWYQASGLPLKRFFNTSGMKYRELNVKSQLDAGMTDEEAFALLATDGMLVKRPILVTDTTAIPGFREETWAEALK